jgi:LacI family transcriptional regulator
MPGPTSNKQRTTKPKTAKIFDVADLAGVSIKTVSRVVNNEPNVMQKTRDKVMAAVRKLDYQPNSAARGLSAKRSYTLGLVYENPREFSYMQNVLNGALQTCDDEGYSLLLLPLTLPDDNLLDDVRQFALKTRMDGLVLTAPLGDQTTVTTMLAGLGIPYACIAPKTSNDGEISISCDDEDASFVLTEFIISLGHRRIGFVKGHPDHGATDKRLQGYRNALKKHDIRYDRKLVRQGYFDFESGKMAAKKLIDLGDRPTAIIASNDDMAAGVVFECHEAGLSIPGDMSVTGFDDTPVAAHIWPQLTTVRQPISEMSSTAVTLLIRKLRGEDVKMFEEVFRCEIVERLSTGPCKV